MCMNVWVISTLDGCKRSFGEHLRGGLLECSVLCHMLKVSASCGHTFLSQVALLELAPGLDSHFWNIGQCCG